MENTFSLVTGAGTRLGLEIAKFLLCEGHNVIAHYHHSYNGIRDLQTIATEHNRTLISLQGDFSNYDGIISFNQDLVSLLAHNTSIKLLVHSAAIMNQSRIADVSYESYQKIQHINFVAPLLISQTLIPYLSNDSNIVMISDIAAERLWIRYPIYSMSKNQLEILAKQLAKALAPRTRVNVVALGLVLRSLDEDVDSWQKRIEKLPLKHTVSLDELFGAIGFIIETPSITGSKITLDGGSLLS